MKKIISKKTVCLVLAAILLVVSLPKVGFAAPEPKVFRVYAYTYAAEAAGWLYMVEYGGNAYIDPRDLETICGNGGLEVEENGRFTFRSRDFIAQGTVGCYTYDGICCVDLREICDIMLAVNRMYNKSDYIPCIAWGRNAAYTGALKVGDKLNVVGRIQSREYKKKLEDGSISDRIAYEVSILKIDE